MVTTLYKKKNMTLCASKYTLDPFQNKERWTLF